MTGQVQLTDNKSTSWSTSGPTTQIRFPPVPPSVRISARTLASSARHAGVESCRCRGALSTSTSDCFAEKGNHEAVGKLLVLHYSQAARKGRHVYDDQCRGCGSIETRAEQTRDRTSTYTNFDTHGGEDVFD